jgi:hypothetical protein
MQAQTLITDVRRELVEISASYWTDAELLRQLNRGELDYTNKTRILEDTAQLSLTQGRLDYPLPSNWLSARGVFYKVVDPVTGTFRWKRLYPTNLEKNSQQRPNFLHTGTDHQGVPNRYWIWGRSLWLDKSTDADNTTSLLLFFKSKPIPLTVATQEINLDDSLSEAITAYILWKAWSKEQEFDRADAQQLTYDRYVAEGRRWVKKQSGDQRNRIDIDSPMPFDGESGESNPLTY